MLSLILMVYSLALHGYTQDEFIFIDLCETKPPPNLEVGENQLIVIVFFRTNKCLFCITGSSQPIFESVHSSVN